MKVIQQPTIQDLPIGRSGAVFCLDIHIDEGGNVWLNKDAEIDTGFTAKFIAWWDSSSWIKITRIGEDKFTTSKLRVWTLSLSRKGLYNESSCYLVGKVDIAILKKEVKQ